MRLKLLILLVAAVFLYWTLYHQPSTERSEKPQEITQPTSRIVEMNKLHSTEKLESNPIKPASNSIDTDAWEQQLIAQLSEPRYSEDLVVEMTSIGFEFEACGNQDTDWFFQNLSLNTQQEKIKSQAETHCNQLANKYPFLTDKKLSNGLSKIDGYTFPASSKLGQYMQKRYQPDSRIDVYQHQQNLITLAIQAANAQMLMSTDLVSSFGPQDLNFAKQTLGSINSQYFENLNSIALTSLSCQFNNGITCTPTAKFMAHKCYEQDQFCGLNFQQWFNLAVTPGMTKDIELLKQHYLQMAES